MGVSSLYKEFPNNDLWKHTIQEMSIESGVDNQLCKEYFAETDLTLEDSSTFHSELRNNKSWEHISISQLIELGKGVKVSNINVQQHEVNTTSKEQCDCGQFGKLL